MLSPEKLPTLRRRLLITASGVLLGVMVIGGLIVGRSLGDDRRESELVEAALPPLPLLEGWPPALERRLVEASARSIEGPDRRTALARLSALYHANGYADEAVEVYRVWLELEPRAPRAAYRLATILAGYGRTEEAVPLLEIVMREAPEYLEAWLQMADIFSKTNHPDQAAALYREVLDRDPERVAAWAGAARVAMQTGDWETARRDLETATRLHPGIGLNWSTLATVYERLGLEEAMIRARWYAELNTITGALPDPWLDELMLDCFDAYRLRVAAFAYRPADSRERDFAIQLFKRALTVGGDRALTHRHLGQTLIELGRHAEARENLEKAVRMAPEIADNWAHLIVACRRLGDEAAVERAIFEGLGHSPRSPSLLLEQGRWLAERQRYPEALRAFEASRRERPGEASASVEIALVYFRLGRTEEGVAQLRQAIEVDPVNPVALTTLTLYAINLGDRAAADHWLTLSRAQPRVPRSDIDDLSRKYGEVFGQAPG